jgi:5-methylcytosine-specific restriction endonuclease McrA
MMVTDPPPVDGWDFCRHPHQEIRRRVDASGRPFYQYQCLDCGDRIGSAMATAIALANGRQPPPFDQEIYESGQLKLDRVLRERGEMARRRIAWLLAERQQTYESYLESDAWRAKRAQALARDEGLCQSCRMSLATQVHHLTYAHLGDELLFELISVCNDCHARIHAAREAQTASP